MGLPHVQEMIFGTTDNVLACWTVYENNKNEIVRVLKSLFNSNVYLSDGALKNMPVELGIELTALACELSALFTGLFATPQVMRYKKEQ